MKTIFATAVALTLAVPASAGTVVFGDSLSDRGNRADIEGDAFPFSIYPNGQFTNGDAWATQVGLESRTENYAIGGATAVDNMDQLPDLLEQVGNYFGDVRLGKRPTADRAAIWIGGNDFRALIGGGFSDPIAATAAFTATAQQVIGTIVGGISALGTSGVGEFVVFGLPDLGQLPEVVRTPFSSLVSGATDEYNAFLRGTVAQLDATTPLKVSFFDVDALFDEVLSEGAFTFTEDSCLSNPVECAENPSQFVFYDNIHPTDGVHTRIADAYAEQFPEVPLPAGFILLLSGLGVLGMSSRRRKSRA